MRRLTIRAHLGAYTGYHEVVNQFFHYATTVGIYVSVRPIAIDEQWGKAAQIPTQMRAQIVHCQQPEQFEILIAPPNNIPTPGKKTVFVTMYESSEMPKEYIATLNRAVAVIVPCRWNAECFANNGVTVPIHVVSLGFDPDVFKPKPVDADGPCVFGIAGRTRHCAKRKGIQESINLFLKTFQLDDNVRLHVKLHGDDTIEDVKDSRIKVERSHFEPYQIAHWLHGLTAYMTLSRGEGFGLWPLQAMACGRTVIGCAYSGQADFLNKENAMIVQHKEVDAVSGESNVQYLGRWAQPDEKQAQAIMRGIQRDRKLAITRGLAAPATVNKLTWEAMANGVISVLEQCGAL